jgi:hypothetical protein
MPFVTASAHPANPAVRSSFVNTPGDGHRLLRIARWVTGNNLLEVHGEPYLGHHTVGQNLECRFGRVL